MGRDPDDDDAGDDLDLLDDDERASLRLDIDDYLGKLLAKRGLKGTDASKLYAPAKPATVPAAASTPTPTPTYTPAPTLSPAVKPAAAAPKPGTQAARDAGMDAGPDPGHGGQKLDVGSGRI